MVTSKDCWNSLTFVCHGTLSQQNQQCSSCSATNSNAHQLEDQQNRRDAPKRCDLQDGMSRLGNIFCLYLPLPLPCSQRLFGVFLGRSFLSHVVFNVWISSNSQKGQGGTSLSEKVTLATPAEWPPLACCLCWLPAPPISLGNALPWQPRSMQQPLLAPWTQWELTRRELSSSQLLWLLSWPQPICLAQCSSEICNLRLEEELLLDLFVPFFLSRQDSLSEMQYRAGSLEGRAVACGAAMIWGCSPKWLYRCFVQVCLPCLAPSTASAELEFAKYIFFF